MLIRNIGAPRNIASPTHNFYTDDIDHGQTIEVDDALGVSLCEQVDVWAPADSDAKKKFETAEKRAERERKAAEKAAQEPATAVAENDNKDGE